MSKCHIVGNHMSRLLSYSREETQNTPSPHDSKNIINVKQLSQMTAKLERTPSTVLQNKDQTQNSEPTNNAKMAFFTIEQKILGKRGIVIYLISIAGSCTFHLILTSSNAADHSPITGRGLHSY